MIRECSICRQEMDDYWMDRYNTGRTTIWICPECKINAGREVDMSEAVKNRARRSEQMARRKR